MIRKIFNSKTLKYVFLNPYKEGSDSSKIKFLYFFLFGQPILIYLDPDPLTLLNPDLFTYNFVNFPDA
jgi:hypothetical protein